MKTGHFRSLALNILGAAIASACAGCTAESLNLGEDGEELAEGMQAISYNGHDYLFVSSPMSWFDAKNTCANVGYYLARIDSEAEENFLAQEELAKGGGGWWIGLSDSDMEGAWKWSVDGSYNGYTNWIAGEPNGGTVSNCALDNGVGGEWNDENCSNLYKYVCESGSTETAPSSLVFSKTSTNNASTNTSDYSVYLMSGQIFSVGTCGIAGASSSGDTFLRLRGTSGAELDFNDNSCGGLGSNISYAVPATGTYNIKAGCAGTLTCSGTVTWSTLGSGANNTLLLMHMDGANGSTSFVDVKGSPITSAGAKLSTTQSRFGGSSAASDVTGVGTKANKVTATGVQNFLNGDFTVELWAFKAATPNSYQGLIIVNDNYNDFYISTGSSTNVVYVFKPTTSTWEFTPMGQLMSAGWNHIAAVRSGNTMYGFVNGVMSSCGTVSRIVPGTTVNVSLFASGWASDNSSFAGYIDEVRITKSALYKSNFTPPAMPFAN